ncbi:3897_t:CDS:1 [Ambispora gerdemannii]|uniref:3897_t:CDS:1 n=1 Tax=Ambispora gerdemannii TaxID=144530 RepID=A0A9N8YXV0_9GLOM|nr:3897_t:CDS:1 [Ambispora gerdemannii]
MAENEFYIHSYLEFSESREYVFKDLSSVIISGEYGATGLAKRRLENEDILKDYHVVVDKDKFKKFEEHLNLIRGELLSIINECNCESENNQQLVLRRDAERNLSNTERSLTSVRTERDSLQIEKRSLERENSRLGDLIRAGERALDRKDDQIRERDRQITTYSTQLTTTQNQLTTTRNDLVAKRNQYDELNARFTTLQITINNKDNEISSLREELEGSQNIDLRYRERKLDELVRNSGLNRVRVINLRDAYESLMRAQEDYNLNNITNANNEIETIKAEFFQTNVNVNDLHKIYKICEKIAELKVKKERLHEQQYQAHQEQPINN